MMLKPDGHMCAALLRGPGDLQLSSVLQPIPKAGEVLLRVLAAGVCQTDVHIRHATDSRTPDGTVLGHEIAGEVIEAGAGVLDWKRGDRVVVHPCWSCGKCRTCLAGRENECRSTGGRLQSPATPGVTTNGGMASYVVAPARTLFGIGDLDPAIAAPLTDAGLTPYHAIMSCRELLAPGSTVVVIGLGGLGNMALQILRAVTASRVVAMDRSETAMEASREWAHVLVRSDDEKAVQTVLDLTDGYGADVVLDFVGIDATMQMAVDMIGRGGAIRVVGLSGGTYSFMARSAGNPLPRGVTIMCPYSGTYNDLAEVLELARSGTIRPIINRFLLKDMLSALDKLEAGQIVGRAVLIPNG